MDYEYSHWPAKKDGKSDAFCGDKAIWDGLSCCCCHVLWDGDSKKDWDSKKCDYDDSKKDWPCKCYYDDGKKDWDIKKDYYDDRKKEWDIKKWCCDDSKKGWSGCHYADCRKKRRCCCCVCRCCYWDC